MTARFITRRYDRPIPFGTMYWVNDSAVIFFSSSPSMNLLFLSVRSTNGPVWRGKNEAFWGGASFLLGLELKHSGFEFGRARKNMKVTYSTPFRRNVGLGRLWWNPKILRHRVRSFKWKPLSNPFFWCNLLCSTTKFSYVYIQSCQMNYQSIANTFLSCVCNNFC